MCKFKDLQKPNHWRIMLFLDHKKTLLEIRERGQNDILEKILIKDRFTVPELSKELNMAQSHIRKYIVELEDLGFLNTCKFKGQIEVIL